MALKLGEILVNKGIITNEELEEAIVQHQKTGQFLGKTLIEMGVVSEREILQALSEQLGIPYRSLKDLQIDEEVIKKVPAKFVWHYKFVPLGINGNILTIALSNPLDIWPIDDIRLHLGYDVETVLACEEEIVETTKKYYGVGAETIERILAETPDEAKLKERLGGETEDLEKLAEDASVIKLVNQILREAIRDRATDIHMEPYRNEVVLRYRVDGLLYDKRIAEDIRYLYQAIVSRIKIMANLDIVERRKPLDGRAKVRVADEELDLRISIIPSIHGENVVIRILPTTRLYSLDKLGLMPDDYKILEEMIKKPHGIIFVTGPTGSGKTTTLYASLSNINTPDRKIITIEDPVEYELKGVTQIQINPAVGLDFSAGLRSVLRHDPDIMMVGEVRDFETAEITVRIALTGHLVFSTLHTNDAPGGVTRLLDMGVEPFLAASSINAFIAQRLVRIICPKCKVEMKLEESEFKGVIDEIGDVDKDMKFFKGTGCKECKMTGYHGRTAIYEILPLNDDIKDLILKKASSGQIKKLAMEQNLMHTLRQDGLRKAARGITTLNEIMRVTQVEE